MNEESKTVEEVAKAAGKAVDATREFGGFIAKYAGRSLEQAMGLVEDKFRYMRWERQVRLVERASEFLKERGLPAPSRTVPLQVMIPLIQAGSLEEDDWMQDRWAALLVNAADASIDTEIRRAFVSILEDLSAFDATVFECVYAVDVGTGTEDEVWTKHVPKFVSEERPEGDMRPSAEVEISLGNLARLGLIASAVFWSGPSPFCCVNKTALGVAFLRGVSRAPQ